MTGRFAVYMMNMRSMMGMYMDMPIFLRAIQNRPASV